MPDEPMVRRRSRIGFWLLCTIVLLGGVLAAEAWMRLQSDRERILGESRHAAVEAAARMVRRINLRMEELRAADHLAEEAANGTLTLDNAWDRICAHLDPGSANILTVAWFPGHVPPPIELAADEVVYYRTSRRIDEACHHSENRYTTEQVANDARGSIDVWYEAARRTGLPTWFGVPYYSSVSHRLWCCGYSVPFRMNGEIAGVVAAEMMVEQANHALYEAESAAFSALPADASYGMLISADGTVLSHPDPDVVGSHRRLGDFIPSDVLADAGAIRDLPAPSWMSDPDNHHDVRVLEDFRYEKSGQVLSIYFAPAGETGWWVAVVLDQDAIDRGEDIRDRVESLTVRLVLAAAAFGFGLFMLALGAFLRGETRLWVAAIVFSVACFALAGWRLDYSLENSTPFYPDEVVLKTRASAAKEVLHFTERHGMEPWTIPTGVFVQSAEFASANNVTVTGLLWQKFDHDLPDWLLPDAEAPEHGFVFPESESSDIRLLYRHDDGSHDVLGWQFRAELRQKFNYERYPFDLETIWIRLWPAALGRGVVLVPDLEAYDSLAPEKQPGIEQNDFVLGGWDLETSFFSYRHNHYNTHLGTGHFVGRSDYPELYFNLGLSRQFLNAFIMNFITLSVVAFLLFAVLFTIKPGDEDSELLGFNVSTVLGFCAALFFVVIISHTSLRQEIAAAELVYLEYYFFALYVAFLGVSVNAILAGSRRPPAWIQAEENAYARLLFWPLLSATMLVVTLFVFR